MLAVGVAAGEGVALEGGDCAGRPAAEPQAASTTAESTKHAVRTSADTARHGTHMRGCNEPPAVPGFVEVVRELKESGQLS